jgi:hypothetical protein
MALQRPASHVTPFAEAKGAPSDAAAELRRWAQEMKDMKKPPEQIILTRENYADWPKWKSLVDDGKVLIDALGRLRYPLGRTTRPPGTRTD